VGAHQAAVQTVTGSFPARYSQVSYARFVKIRALSIGLLLSVLVAGCGDRDNAEPTNTATATTSSPASTASPTTNGPSGASGPSEFEGARALEHVRVLSEEIGPRVSGTPAEAEAAEYLAEQFRSYGYDVEVMEFTFSGDRFNGWGRSRGGSSYEALALVGSASGTVTAASVWVGLADDADIGGGPRRQDRGGVTGDDPSRRSTRT
jgi:hypothetical protein